MLNPLRPRNIRNSSRRPKNRKPNREAVDRQEEARVRNIWDEKELYIVAVAGGWIQANHFAAKT
jgi:hypothetical protein